MVYPFESSTLPFERMARTKVLCAPRSDLWDLHGCKWTDDSFNGEVYTCAQGFQPRTNGS